MHAHLVNEQLDYAIWNPGDMNGAEAHLLGTRLHVWLASVVNLCYVIRLSYAIRLSNVEICCCPPCPTVSFCVLWEGSLFFAHMRNLHTWFVPLVVWNPLSDWCRKPFLETVQHLKERMELLRMVVARRSHTIHRVLVDGVLVAIGHELGVHDSYPGPVSRNKRQHGAWCNKRTWFNGLSYANFLKTFSAWCKSSAPEAVEGPLSIRKDPCDKLLASQERRCIFLGVFDPIPLLIGELTRH